MIMYPKIIFMDLEGTLLKKEYKYDNGKVAPSAWTVLAKQLGDDCYLEEEETKNKWLRGEYSGYVEWMRDTVRLHQKYGLTIDKFTNVMDSVEFMPGVEKAVKEFKRYGATTAIISGGFKRLADRVQKILKIDHALCGCEYFFNDDTGFIEHFNLLPSDEAGKVDFMKLLLKEYNLNTSDCVFVGDGKNDIHLASEAGYSIAFNAQPELQKVCDISINQEIGCEDFFKVAQIISKQFM